MLQKCMLLYVKLIRRISEVEVFGRDGIHGLSPISRIPAGEEEREISAPNEGQTVLMRLTV